MERRDALKRLAMAGLSAASAPSWLSAQAEDPWTPRVLTPHQNESVVTLTELIIPQTDTAGAKAARVNVFIDTVLADADESARDAFLSGLEWMDERSRELFGADFVAVAAVGIEDFDAGGNLFTGLIEEAVRTKGRCLRIALSGNVASDLGRKRGEKLPAFDMSGAEQVVAGLNAIEKGFEGSLH